MIYRLKTIAALALLLGLPSFSCATERGQTHYLAGYYGDFAVAIAPSPGTYAYSTLYRYEGKSSGSAVSHVEATAVIGGFLVATNTELFGARYAFGAYTANVNANLDVTLPTAMGVATLTDDNGGLTDTSVSPLSLFWSDGDLHVNFYVAAFLPTGGYKKDLLLTPGRNYYSFDNVLALTWLNPQQGLEISAAAGLMFNTENPDTDYRSGTEFHLDYMLNAYLSRTLAFGLHGYVYDQWTDDQGPNTLDSQSFGAGIGPAFLWVPSEHGLKGKVVGKWLHEFGAENRFEGDILSLTAMLQF